jgi:hypothetical protein
VPGAGTAREPARPPPGNRFLDPSVKPHSRTEARGHGMGAIPDRPSLSVPSDPVGDRVTTAACDLEEPVPASGVPALRPRRLAWAELLRRVFAVDVLECPSCGGRMRLLAAIQPPDATEAILIASSCPGGPHPHPRRCLMPRSGPRTSARRSEATPSVPTRCRLWRQGERCARGSGRSGRRAGERAAAAA